MHRFIIVCPTTGKAVQTWTFAGKKAIVYCTGPEWAMKFGCEEGARRTVDYLKKNFPVQNLVVMKVQFEMKYSIAPFEPATETKVTPI